MVEAIAKIQIWSSTILFRVRHFLFRLNTDLLYLYFEIQTGRNPSQSKGDNLYFEIQTGRYPSKSKRDTCVLNFRLEEILVNLR